jgi:lipoprotein-anchoring transpeptidase ErfK/SrfK
MRPIYLALPLLITLAACKISDGTPPDANATQVPAGPIAAASPVGLVSPSADPLAAHDGAVTAQEIPDSEPRPVMQAQVVLDRLGFTPGVVDGKPGLSTRNAVSGFQEANGLTVTGQLDAATKAALTQYQTIPATRLVTIPADFAAGPFVKIPKRPEDQAKLTALGYESLDEKLAERFHTTIATLKLLNPGGRPAGAPKPAVLTASPNPSATPASSAMPIPNATDAPISVFSAGQQIRVPNVGGDTIASGANSDAAWQATLAMLGVGSEQPKAARIVVSKSKGTLKAYDAADKLIAVYTATMGSTHDPLPLGEWGITGIGHNPKFHYNPDLFWDAKAGSEKATLPAGPNGPVGVVWIDLTKEHYGIHGTPHPETIGRAESHGCVRLTNWDAARLAQMVSTRTKVSFEA